MQQHRSIFLAGLSLLIAALALFLSAPAGACPFCSAPSLTLSEQYVRADAALLVQWVSGEMQSKERLGSTTYEVVQVARSPGKDAKAIEKGKKITLERYRAAKRGDLFLLLGSRLKADTVEWGSPLDVTAESFNYIVDAPAADAKPEKRLGYYLKFLENPDRMVADDAYAEFANAPYKEIVPLAKQFPRDSLRKWITSPEVPATRLGLYGLMLGLCGNDDDAAIMQTKIVENSDGFRLGIEGIMWGYLMLTGENGLDTIIKSKIEDKKVAFSETFAAMQALRNLWIYGDNRIPAERLKETMRLLLERPELTDLVISDLARWKDWSIQGRLMELYGAEDYDIPSIKRAIVRYMMASIKDVPAGGGEKTPRHVTEGEKYLKQLRDRDPKMVNEVERYFYLQ